MESDDKNELTRNRRVSAVLRKKLLDKYNHCCVSCGVTNDVTPLELSHIVPIARGGDTSEGNVILLCQKCRQNFDRQPREYEFVNFLVELLTRHPQFRDVKREVLLGRETRYRADIVVSRKVSSKEEVLLIECKTFLARTSSHVIDVIAQLERYQSVAGNVSTVLAVPATLQEAKKTALQQTTIEV